MKPLFKLSIISSLLLSASVYAVNPSQGFYLGLFGEISSGPPSYTQLYDLVTPDRNYTFIGRSNFSRIGGGGFGLLGYRYNQVRFEVEGLYNWAGAGSFIFEGCRLQSPNILTPIGACDGPVSTLARETNAGFNGSISALYGLVNVVYDIIDYDSDRNLFPYLGVGLGYLSLKNQVNFINTVTKKPNQSSIGTSALFNNTAAQVILGLGYFMDDFTWGSIDYRYISSTVLRDFDNKRFALHTLNFGVNLSFDKSSG